MSRALILFSLCLLLLCSGAAVARATAPSPREIDRALEAALDDDSLQTTWPEGRAPLERGRVERRSPSAASVARDAAPFAGVLMWIVAGAGVIILLLALARSIADRPRDPLPAARPVPEAGETASSPRRAFGDPAALAAEGRFADALHAMLLLALARVTKNLRLSTTDSLTSREIVAQLLGQSKGPEPDYLAALRDLVRAVEFSHFGGREVTRADYERYRPAFDAAMGGRPSRGAP